jgi:mono/diheme cytochrome c family protein
MRSPAPRRRRLLAGIAAILVVLAVPVVSMATRNDPERHDDIIEHYKYGSIGSETLRAGIPYWMWRVLPEIFSDLLPNRPGTGYERFGFVYESPSHDRPIGISLRQLAIPTVGLNCAACHTGTIRDAAGAAPRIVLGMPSHQLDLQAYARFIFAAGRDPRFNSQTFVAAIQKVNPAFSAWDRFFYGTVVVPLARRELERQRPNFEWQDSRPPWGPGRVDTFNPYKTMFQLPVATDATVGTADLPAFYDQRTRHGMALHWDGNNDETTERNKSAALGAGCTEDSIDLPAIERIERWVWDLKPPKMAAAHIDAGAAARGAALFQQHCADCHAAGGSRIGTVIAIAEIGTDPERLHSFSPELAQKMNTLGAGRPWAFSHFRKTNGYAAAPLDGVWVRAPYLHNGSVPTLRDLLNAPAERPASFYRGYDVYDYGSGGFITTGPDAERSGVLFRTELKGNSNAGHLYGTALAPAAKNDLVEYLKSL